MDKLPVTVVIIAKNEENRITKCIESVRWADEIIVVDGFSSDGTREVSESLGARVIQHKFTGTFADDRNVGMDNARNDWVLQLDADEVVTEGFRANLERALAKREDAAVYKFRRRNFFLGHSMNHGGFHHYIPNLVNKNFVRFEGVVHEVPVYKGKESVVEGDIEHYPFSSIAQFIDRQNRYSTIAAGELFKKEGILPDGKIRKGLIGRSWKIFWKSYVRKQGYREGLYGLVFAALFAFINFMKWAKYWEMVKDEDKNIGSGNS